MNARLSLYQKAEEELYKLDRTVKSDFYNFCHRFRLNPDHPGLDLKPLKGNARIYRAKLGSSYRVLLARAGEDVKGLPSWLVLAVRHRKDVYEQLDVAVNRISGEIEFVDLSVVGESTLRRAGVRLTRAEPETAPAPEEAPAPAAEPVGVTPATPLLTGHTAGELRDLGVAEPLIDLALAVTDEAELDSLVRDAPLLSKDVLYGLAAGMPPEDIRAEITSQMRADTPVDPDDFGSALSRMTVTTVDEDVQAAIEEGDFRLWKVFLHPSQARLVEREYSGPARVSGGPGTGKTIVALHRVHHLARQLPPGHSKPILLTTFTKNLTTELRARLSSLMAPELMARVDIVNIDQLAARVAGESAPPGRIKNRVEDRVALRELRHLLAEAELESGPVGWDAEFLFEEWEQVILGQSVPTRAAYFRARRAGRGKALTRPDRDRVWKLIEQFTARLDKLGVETWGQSAERAARFEIERAAKIAARREHKAEIGGGELVHRDGDDGSGMRYLRHRYRHIVVDEAQDLRPAHWKMLRAMAGPGPDDLFIAGDTHQRLYGNQVALGAVGINIRGRASRLTLSYRTTREILAEAMAVVRGESFDDLDDGTDTLDGYRSVLRGPAPLLAGYATWDDELAALAQTLLAWRTELTGGEGGAAGVAGRIAVCAADQERVGRIAEHLARHAGLTCAELSKDGPRGGGEIHVGTMHRLKGLEYQRLAIAGVSEGVLPRSAVSGRPRTEDPQRAARELRRARSVLFVAATRARDVLSITWHGAPSPLLGVR
ncbi:UvrD-helicase domain-containing protein [Streptomyces xiamenensis]|uniref:UvrD-helicase domain-containing protein n=1 Tax=Streptomyces xiamenensis TaxID=408015 RepID=UPI00342033AC